MFPLCTRNSRALDEALRHKHGGVRTSGGRAEAGWPRSLGMVPWLQRLTHAHVAFYYYRGGVVS